MFLSDKATENLKPKTDPNSKLSCCGCFQLSPYSVRRYSFWLNTVDRHVFYDAQYRKHDIDIINTWRRLEVILRGPVTETEAVAGSYCDTVHAGRGQLVYHAMRGSGHHLVGS